MWLFLRSARGKSSIIPLSICIALGIVVFFERKWNLNVAVLSHALNLKTRVLTDIAENAESQDHFNGSAPEKLERIAVCGAGRSLGKFFLEHFFIRTDSCWVNKGR